MATPPPSFPSDLVYVTDADPGISRLKRGKGFAYYDPDGGHIRCARTLERIRGLGIPPAYRSVWICVAENGHIQATGLDDADRKQYRYHPLWSDYRAGEKYERLALFGRALPRIRRRVAKALRDEGTGRERAIAAVVRLIDDCAIRIGGRRRHNAAVGATGLAKRNIRMLEDGIALDYVAKGGKRARFTVHDAQLMEALDEIDDLPGRRLFQYLGEDGAPHALDSGQVNDWLRALAPESEATAKTFRTWAGSLAAFEAAGKSDAPTIKALCDAAAERLRNTPAICRGSYVHPAVIALTEMDEEERKAVFVDIPSRPNGLRKAERGMLRLLEAH